MIRLEELKYKNQYYELWFNVIAHNVLQSTLIVGDQKFFIDDITIHYYSKSHYDTNVRKVSEQQKNLHWYVTKYSKYASPPVIDLTFSENDKQDSYGGINIRAIRSKEKDKFFSGTKSVHDKICEILKLETIDKINEWDALKSKIRIECYEGASTLNFYKLIRPGVYQEENKNWGSVIYPYRFSRNYIFPEHGMGQVEKTAAILMSHLYHYGAESRIAFKNDDIKIIDEFYSKSDELSKTNIIHFLSEKYK